MGGGESRLKPALHEGAARSWGWDVFAVDFRGDRTHFLVNDAGIADLPGEPLAAGGIVGIRAGGGLSLHVTEVEIGPNRRRRAPESGPDR